ncbi:uncharacterized protein N7496_006046 [Penicillium cataractarum]|uniref:Uncharacterized protein n=1 Tax=Penicillium cataractarum TaxID=2100454 RepID=A0A9W9V706_9EURO|nr:uncharacterized protein N7496_006046 [Penicillium cataractarum]KAJ5369954.1 hypothetical protein N7496_006046 [Penicillium cataractarum]
MMSNFMQKIEEAVSDYRDRDNMPTDESITRGPDIYDSGMIGTYTANVGPHDSKAANKLDCRVDSDLDRLRKQVYRCKPIIKILTQVLLKTAEPRNQAWNFRTSAAPPPKARTLAICPSIGKPGTFGIDNHDVDKIKYNKPTQQQKAHT